MAIDLLQIQPHQISRDLSGYITYIFGGPKVGKTYLASQAKNCLLVATERGYNAIPGIYPQDVTSWGEMRQVYRELKKPEVKEKFDVVIIDTVDLAAKYCTKYICSKNEIQELSDLPYGKGYQLMRDEFEEVFNSLAQMGYSIIFISHAQDAIFTRPDGTEYTRIIPSLSPPKVNAIIENMADIYGYAHIEKDNEGQSHRILTLRSPDDSIACGCRFRYIEEEIPLGYKELVDALNKAIDKEAEVHGEEMVTDKPQVFEKVELDFDDLMNQFNKLVVALQNATGGEFGTVWAPRIVEVTNKYLGPGNTVTNMSRSQVEQLDLIVTDLTDLVGQGI